MKKRCLIWLGALFLLCASCALTSSGGEKSTAGEYKVYFVSNVRSENGESWGSADSGALKSESRPLDGEVERIEGLLELLMSGPESEELVSPFPAGVRVRSWRLDGKRVTVDLSESYGGLAGVELTLADSCIVLTLCQLDAVEEVYLTVEGRRRPFRDQVYTASDFIENNRATTAPTVAEPQETEEAPAEGRAVTEQSAFSEEDTSPPPEEPLDRAPTD